MADGIQGRIGFENDVISEHQINKGLEAGS
jgi:hypothetical protein